MNGIIQKLKIIGAVVVLLAPPQILFAAVGLIDIINAAFALVKNVLIPLAFALALFYFFWGVAKYIRSEGSGKAEGRSVMVWGVVALTVLTLIWAIVNLLRTELGISDIVDAERPVIYSADSTINYLEE